MSKPIEQIEVRNGGDVASGGEVGPFEGTRRSTASIDDKVKAIEKPLLARRDERMKDDQVTCCCFDLFKKQNSSKAAQKECEDRKRGFLYWFLTILAL